MTREEALKLLGGVLQGYLLKDDINQIYNDHEAQIKAKDEEIERLKDQLSSVHNLMYRNGYSDAIDCYDTFGKFNTKYKPNAKARSIVAMLFGEWRKDKRIYENANRFTKNISELYVNCSELSFKKAYKILKDTK